MGEVFSLLSIAKVDYYQNIYQIFSLTSLKYYLELEIRTDKSKWIVLNTYRPPASNIQSFIDELSNILDKTSRNMILSW